MREQLAIMIQHYEDNEKVLKRLLALYETIDGSLAMIKNAQHGYSKGGEDEESDSDESESEEIPCAHNVSHQGASCNTSTPLSSSVVVAPSASMLVVSGIVEDIHRSTNNDSDTGSGSEEEDSPWDKPVTQQELAMLELQQVDISTSQVPIDLSVSVVMGDLSNLMANLGTLAADTSSSSISTSSPVCILRITSMVYSTSVVFFKYAL